jgi:hypothetical protein
MSIFAKPAYKGFFAYCSHTKGLDWGLFWGFLALKGGFAGLKVTCRTHKQKM